MKITIIGFGNIAHALIAYLGSKAGVELSVLASKPYVSDNIELVGNPRQSGTIKKISDDPSVVIPNRDMLLFTVPSHVRRNELQKVAPYISENTIIGAFPGIGGFYDEVREIVGDETIAFASQRVPFIARIIKKGQIVRAVPKDKINIAVSRDSEKVQKLLSELLDMRVEILDNFMEVHLTNSNPILHSARLYSLFLTQDYPFDRRVLFYEDWDDGASKVLLEMDDEFMYLVNKLALKHIRSLKEHYNVDTVEQMTEKMQNIEAFKEIEVPLIQDQSGYIFDQKSRYFQEDIGHDLAYIIKIADSNGVSTSVIHKVYDELNKLMEKK